MSLKKNIIANYLGQGWVALMQLAFVPVYINCLGMESYGLIGVFAMLQAWLALLDVGMTPTLNREMARFTAGAHTSESIRDLLRSLEIVSLLIAFFVAIGIWGGANWFSQHWLSVGKLPIQVVTEAIAIMGLVAAMRVIESIYRGALLGLQAQVWLNVVSAVLSTIRGGGAVVILYWVSSSVQMFFVWQGCVSIATVVVFSLRVYREIPPPVRRVKFSLKALADIWVFARGMIVTTLLSLMLLQVDKILLSRLLSLEEFGAYTLASAVANALGLLIYPLSQSYYPKFTKLITNRDEVGLVSAYHQGAQLMTVILIPATLILFFHGDFLLFLWTGNSNISSSAASLVALLAFGTTLNGLVHIPYMLQLAHGWSSLAAKINFIMVLFVVPALVLLVPRYGAVGAAWVWILINAAYVVFGVNFMYRRILSNERNGWYINDICFPALAAGVILFFCEFLFPDNSSSFVQLIYLIISGALAFFWGGVAASELRKFVFGLIGKVCMIRF